MPGITYQGTLDDFWFAAPRARPDHELYQRFRAHLMAETQLNGSFYKPLKLPGVCAGLLWPAPLKSTS
jgi:capsular polysaccharide export protein